MLCPATQPFCKSNKGTYTIPKLKASDNCGIATVSYEIAGNPKRGTSGYDASGAFGVGTSTITWTVTDVNGNKSTCITTVTVSNNTCNNDSREYVTDQNPQPGKEQTKTTAANSGNNSKGSLFISDVFKVIVAPNPSTTDFRLHVQSSSNAPINIQVTDAVGRVLAVITSVHSNSEVTFGLNYRGGSYFAEVVQGANHKTVKLIKL